MSLARSAVRLVCALSALLVVMLLAVPSADAQFDPPLGSVALRWDNCYGDGGAAAHSFACNSNSGSDLLVVSIIPPYDLVDVTQVAGRIQITTTGAVTPSWWTIGIGGCRSASALGFSTVRPATSTTCLDPWLGQAIGGTAITGSSSPTSAVLQFVAALPNFGTVSIPGNTEVFICSISILHPKTVGTGSCAGCPTSACIGIDFVEASYAGPPYTRMHLPLPNTTSDVVGWQMDASMPETMAWEGPAGFESWQKHFTGCSAAVIGTHRSTWGTVKSLYR